MLNKTARYVTIFICCWMAKGSVLAQNIDFVSGNWESVKQKAAKEKKPVFIDIFTVWCGPCKKMANTVFTQQKVAQHFNSRFINFKVDAEKGEGITLAEKYQVMSYPTYLFVDADGKLLYRIEGSLDADTFIKESQHALK